MRIFIPSARSKMLSLQTLHQTLSGIPPSSDIHKIVIVPAVAKPGGTICEQLDLTLSTLPLDPLPIVELEMRRKHYESVVSHFPRLTSKDLVRSSIQCCTQFKTPVLASPRWLSQRVVNENPTNWRSNLAVFCNGFRLFTWILLTIGGVRRRM